MTDLFILDENNNPVPMAEPDLIPWGQWVEEAQASGRCVVGDDTLDRFHVRTVFGGCDNNWDGGTPVLFETRVTEGGERRDLFLRRYESWEQAATGHKEVCKNIRNDSAADG